MRWIGDALPSHSRERPMVKRLVEDTLEQAKKPVLVHFWAVSSVSAKIRFAQ